MLIGCFLTIFSMSKPFFCAIELRRAISLSPNSGFLKEERKKIESALIEWMTKMRKLLTNEQKCVLPLPQTVVKVNVTLGGNLSIYCIRLRR